MLYIICKKYLPKSPSCDKIINVAKISRHVGMADEADSKSVDGDIVWVQVPLPALHPWQGKVSKLAYLRHFWDFFFYRQAYRLTDADTFWSPGFIVSIISSRCGVYVLLKKQMIYCMM
jgi:hypothetical protein